MSNRLTKEPTMHANTKIVLDQYFGKYRLQGFANNEGMANEIADARETIRSLMTSAKERQADSMDKAERNHLQVIIDNAKTFLDLYEPQPSH
jgi:hypothetical protein